MRDADCPQHTFGPKPGFGSTFGLNVSSLAELLGMSGGTIKVSAWSPPHAARLSETSRKDALESCSTTSAFGADADDLIALIAVIMLN